MVVGNGQEFILVKNSKIFLLGLCFFFFSLPFFSISSVNLEELSEIADGIFEGKFVHFGSCRTMLGSQTRIEDFCRNTGAKMVSGFTKKVDCALCAIHDMAFIAETINCKQVPSVISHMDKLYGGLQDKLGFRYAL